MIKRFKKLEAEVLTDLCSASFRSSGRTFCTLSMYFPPQRKAVLVSRLLLSQFCWPGLKLGTTGRDEFNRRARAVKLHVRKEGKLSLPWQQKRSGGGGGGGGGVVRSKKEIGRGFLFYFSTVGSQFAANNAWENSVKNLRLSKLPSCSFRASSVSNSFLSWIFAENLTMFGFNLSLWKSRTKHKKAHLGFLPSCPRHLWRVYFRIN